MVILSVAGHDAQLITFIYINIFVILQRYRKMEGEEVQARTRWKKRTKNGKGK